MHQEFVDTLNRSAELHNKTSRLEIKGLTETAVDFIVAGAQLNDTNKSGSILLLRCNK